LSELGSWWRSNVRRRFVIPVSLSLENFLSYRRPEEPLNFEGFNVACLSGGNGQGKSALLDAITWALWGEGRKSQGTVKPDEHLMRSGASEMSVTFVFDLEGTRFRVKRYFGKSGSRKTQKSNLEFQVFDAERGEFVTQTGARIKDTQGVLNQHLGLTYETFINASFLLQGRSDQFTKQAPTERKRILADILNLHRYEQLREKALEKAKEARNSLEVAEMRLQQLEEQTRDLPHWIEVRDEAKQSLHIQEKSLQAFKSQELLVLNELISLDLKVSEIRAEERHLAQLLEQTAFTQDRRTTLDRLITEAAGLMQEEARIRTENELFLRLSAEQEALQHKSELARSFEDQLSRIEQEIQKRIVTTEQELASLKQGFLHYTTQLNEEDARILREPEVLRALRESLEATAKWEAMKLVKETVQSLTEALARVSQEITIKERSLQIEKTRIMNEIKDLAHVVVQKESLSVALVQAQESHQLFLQHTETLHELRTIGQVQKAEMQAEKAKSQQLETEIEQLHQNKLLVQHAKSETCPTCGTRLTEDHRSHMLELYTEQEAEAAQRKIRQDTLYAEKRRIVQETSQKYKTLEAICSQMADSSSRLTTAQTAFMRVEQAEERALVLQKSLSDTEQKIQNRTGIKLLDEEKQQYLSALQQLAFNETAFSQLAQLAARKDLLERERRTIEAARGKAESLRVKTQHTEHQAQQLRSDLATGIITQELEAKKAVIRQKMAEVGYDRARHQEVRLALGRLKNVPQQFNNLLNAIINANRYTTEQKDLFAQEATLSEQQVATRQRLHQLREATSVRPSFEAKRVELAGYITQTQQNLDTSREQLGRLESRIDIGEKDRDEIQRIKTQNRETIRQRELFTHLSKAFGPEGIPAIIIEETLPELQDRANDLLSRLTDGRMSIRLETIKNMKSGGSKSTLDIIINDELAQPRPYETFSGGEAFRIDFALRIALSQLLAERAGVRIRTLVIDEGFGTQDQQGIQQMIEAIEAIRQDFEKIIIITHLDELKNAFPVRIEVRKEPDGSRYEVYHEG